MEDNMDANRFDDWVRWVGAVRSRRTIARLLGSGALLVPLTVWQLSGAQAKKNHHHKGKKKRHNKPPASPPPPTTQAPYCAGAGNACIADNPLRRFCSQPGTTPICDCYNRADIAEPFCGTPLSPLKDVSKCADCAGGEVCVVAGFACSAPFSCVRPCPNPI
jgi:hypothetical protein